MAHFTTPGKKSPLRCQILFKSHGVSTQRIYWILGGLFSSGRILISPKNRYPGGFLFLKSNCIYYEEYSGLFAYHLDTFRYHNPIFRAIHAFRCDFYPDRATRITGIHAAALPPGWLSMA